MEGYTLEKIYLKLCEVENRLKVMEYNEELKSKIEIMTDDEVINYVKELVKKEDLKK